MVQSQIDDDFRVKLLESFRSGTNPFVTYPSRSQSDTTLSENIYENLKQLTTTNDYYNPENIYENICHDCGRIYDDICGFCNDDAPFALRERQKNRNFIKKLFRFKTNLTKRNKIRKSDICLVRSDTVFKTNCTFDMTEMSRMRHEYRGTNTEDELSNDDVDEATYENLLFHTQTTSVSSWIKALGAVTEDYDASELYNVKAIPSKTFDENVSGDLKTTESDTDEIIERLELFLESFKRHKNAKKPAEVTISWYEGSNNPFLNSPEVTSLERNLEDNFNLTTTSVSRHQDNERHLSVISQKSVDNDLLVRFNNDDDKHDEAATQLINRLLLSISLNTITLSYDKYFKKIYWLQKGDNNYLCAAEPSASLTFTVKKRQKIKSGAMNPVEAPSSSALTLDETPKKPETPEKTPETPSEVNNDIYYFIWNCDSQRLVPKSIRDNQNWILASDDFTSATDLMDIVDDIRDSFAEGNVKHDSRRYSEVVIFYNDENSHDNRIIYGGEENATTKPKKNIYSNEPFFRPGTDKKKRLDMESLPNSVKEFLVTIRDNEDEDEVIIHDEPILLPSIVITEEVTEPDGSTGSRTEEPSHNHKFLKNHEKPPKSDKTKTRFELPKEFPEKIAKEKLKRGSRIKSREKLQISQKPKRTSSFNSDRQSFVQERTNLRHAKSTSNLADLGEADEPKNLGFFMKLKNLFKKRDHSVFLGPGPEDNKIFGNSLGKLRVNENLNVPTFVVTCIEALEDRDVIETMGLYRASGNKTTMDEIRKKIDNLSSKSDKRYNCLTDQEPNTLTGLLKQFFRELTPGLINPEIANECVDNPCDIAHLRKQINTLGVYEKATLKYLIKHLTHVNEHREANLMDSNNLSIVWGPCLFKAVHSVDAMQSGKISSINRVVKTMIDHYEEIFDE